MNAPVLALSGSNLTGDVPFSCALAAGGVVHEQCSPAGARGDLPTLVARACEQASLPPAAVRELLVDVGPGSYTGLRVALTFVRFVQRFGGASVQALDSLALLAARARPAPGLPPRRVRIVLDARRERVHTQVFHVDAARIGVAEPAAALPLAQLLARLAPGERVVAPAVLPASLRTALARAGAELQLESRVTALAMLREPGLPFTAAGAADLEPRYLMGSYAEG